MFRSTTRNLRSWWTDFSADILGADLEPSVYDEELPDPAPGAATATIRHHREHPHRTPLTSRHIRRDGAVPARPADCLSPLRPERQQVGDAINY